MASLRLALKASLEAAESQPPPKKSNSTSKSTVAAASSSRHRTPESPLTDRSIQQTTRKRSHSDASSVGAGDDQPRGVKKKPPRRSSGGEGAVDKDDKDKERDKKSTPHPPAGSTNKKDQHTISSSSSASSSSSSIPEWRERSTPTRKAAVTANKQFSSPPPPPLPTAATPPLPSGSDNNTKHGSAKKNDAKSNVVESKSKHRHSDWSAELNEAPQMPSSTGGGTKSPTKNKESVVKIKSKLPAKEDSQSVSDRKSNKDNEAAAPLATPKDVKSDTKIENKMNKQARETVEVKRENDVSVSSTSQATASVGDSSGKATSKTEEKEIASEGGKPTATSTTAVEKDTSTGKAKANEQATEVPAVLQKEPSASNTVKTGTKTENAGAGAREESGVPEEGPTTSAGASLSISVPDGVQKRTVGSSSSITSSRTEGGAEGGTEGGRTQSSRKRSSSSSSLSGGQEDDKALSQKAAEGSGGMQSGGGYQSPRAAAQLAKSRLTLSGTSKASRAAVASAKASEECAAPSTAVKPTAAAATTTAASSRKSLTPRERKSLVKKEKAAAEEAPAHWVACDVCGKWRSLPGSVDISVLPEQWYCSMNEWDSAHNDCSKEEEEYVEPGTAVAPVTTTAITGSRSTGSLSALEEGEKKDQEGTEGGGGAREVRVNRGKRLSRGTDDETGGTGGSRRRVSRGGRASTNSTPQPSPETAAASSSSPEMVSWVQCNKCSKWRKVPYSIGEELPDVWYCSMNTWALEYSKCSTKEEVDEKVPEDDKGGREKKTSTAATAGSGGGRGKYVRGGSRKGEGDVSAATAAAAFAPGKTVVKKIQWVQCERKNCKKWRKIPIEVDLASLPEQWFCEMNQWDPERAACDLAEDSDDEGDQPANQAARTQLILGNSKGPGTLSYRRLIFGADGRIRPFYSEKNKNGYGLFSFTEVFRPSESEDYILPTRRIGYWASSSFDGNAKLSKEKEGGSSKKSSKKQEEQSASEEGREITFQTSASSLRPDNSTDLIDCIMRLGGRGGSGETTSGGHIPAAAKVHKAYPLKMKCNLLHRMQLACSVVQNYLLLFSGNPQPQTFEEIFHGLTSLIFFHTEEMEQCRQSMGRGELHDTLHRLDQRGAVEATFDNDGALSFRLLLQHLSGEGEEGRENSHYSNRPYGLDDINHNPCPALLASYEPTPLAGKLLPPKMRKRKVALQSPPLPSTVSSSGATMLTKTADSNKQIGEVGGDSRSKRIKVEIGEDGKKK